MKSLIEIMKCRNCNDRDPVLTNMSWLTRELAAAVNRRLCRIAVLCVSLLLAVSAPSRPAPLTATVRLTPATLVFGSQLVGTSSVSQAVTLTSIPSAMICKAIAINAARSRVSSVISCCRANSRTARTMALLNCVRCFPTESGLITRDMGRDYTKRKPHRDQFDNDARALSRI